MFFSPPGAAPPSSPWFATLDRFVRDRQLPLAALAWELRREWGDLQDYLGLDLEPTPHFFRCSYAQLESLNQSVDRQIQELLGLLLHHDPERETAIVALAQGQVKLLYFQPELPPPQCLDGLGISLDELIPQLETELLRLLTP
ncbi:MAG: hypothetical protein ACK5CA_12790 [Cyanobacteriota bacterium]|jgi:hypothetical protein